LLCVDCNIKLLVHLLIWSELLELNIIDGLTEYFMCVFMLGAGGD